MHRGLQDTQGVGSNRFKPVRNRSHASLGSPLALTLYLIQKNYNNSLPSMDGLPNIGSEEYRALYEMLPRVNELTPNQLADHTILVADAGMIFQLWQVSHRYDLGLEPPHSSNRQGVTSDQLLQHFSRSRQKTKDGLLKPQEGKGQDLNITSVTKSGISRHFQRTDNISRTQSPSRDEGPGLPRYQLGSETIGKPLLPRLDEGVPYR